ncbi:MAG: DNA-processing protein DprA [Candidatus Eisenbacteria bacterium]
MPAPIGARALSDGEPGYPPGLRDLGDAPRAVFVRGGRLPACEHAIAIVGSRAASRYGLERARRLAGDLARLGYTVVSGLARGIDAAAHRGALDSGGRTVAVIPSGLDAITPRHHLELASEIAARGVLLTEWESGDPRGRGVFVRRNRLIAALAAATVVVEAAERSGALTTAAFARRLGRPVLAVPGDVDRETARGCHALIKGGARLCESAGDVLEAIGASRPAGVSQGARPAACASEPSAGEGTPESRLLAVLTRDPLTVDALAHAAGLSVPQTLTALLALQWAGAVLMLPGQRWARASS